MRYYTEVIDGRTKYYVESSSKPGTYYMTTKKPADYTGRLSTKTPPEATQRTALFTVHADRPIPIYSDTKITKVDPSNGNITIENTDGTYVIGGIYAPYFWQGAQVKAPELYQQAQQIRNDAVNPPQPTNQPVSSSQKSTDANSMTFEDWQRKYGGTREDWMSARYQYTLDRKGLGELDPPVDTGVGGAGMDDLPMEMNEVYDQYKSMFESAVDALVEILKDSLPANVDPVKLSDAELDAIMKEAEATIGPQFTRLKERAQQDFSTAQRFARENLQRYFQEVGEDVDLSRKRLIRNYHEAMADTQASLANRGLTYGSTRKKEEGKLETQKQEGIGDLERAASRNLKSQQTEFERMYGSAALPGLTGLDYYSFKRGGETGTEQLAYTRSLEDITRERAQALETEYQRRKGLRELPA
jgi:hypothetical protein